MVDEEAIDNRRRPMRFKVSLLIFQKISKISQIAIGVTDTHTQNFQKHIKENIYVTDYHLSIHTLNLSSQIFTCLFFTNAKRDFRVQGKKT